LEMKETVVGWGAGAESIPHSYPLPDFRHGRRSREK